MQPTLVKQPFQREGWIFEEKVDGYRMLASGTSSPALSSGTSSRYEPRSCHQAPGTDATPRRGSAGSTKRWGPERGGGATMIAAIYAHKSTDRAAAGE
jgi:hypothetical protein